MESVGITPYRRTTANGSASYTAGSFTLTAEKGQIYFSGKPVGQFVEFAPTEGFALAGKTYRGNLYAVYDGGTILFINRIALEEYLLGVVPSEVPASFPEAVLQAQAILARTYAISRLSPKGQYDICSTEKCQVYGGVNAEHPKHTTAVLATRGLIVSYNNKPISALYHADSGGFTASSEEVWGGSIPYLIARPDPYSESSNSNWSKEISPAAVQLSLNNMGSPVGSVSSIEMVSESESGRPASIRITGSSKTIILQGALASRLLRGLGLKSTRGHFEGWTFYGQGSGHGVGMSQWGARGMVISQGWDYRMILGYYYPGTFLGNFKVVTAKN